MHRRADERDLTDAGTGTSHQHNTASVRAVHVAHISQDVGRRKIAAFYVSTNYSGTSDAVRASVDTYVDATPTESTL